MTVSRVSYNRAKNYEEVQFNEDVSLLDSELNELQMIIQDHFQDSWTATLGVSVRGDDWLVVPNGNANSININAGIFWQMGNRIRLDSNMTISFLSTPVVDRTDCVFIEYTQAIINSTEDPNILDPQVGSETTQRIVWQYDVQVAEGSSVPTPQPGYYYIQIARLNRQGGNPNITQDMIQDDRLNTMHTYVVGGCAVTAGVGLNVTIGLGQVRVATVDYYISNTTPTLAIPPNSSGWVIMNNQNPQFVTSLPFNFYVVLAQVTSDASSVTVTDQRFFMPIGFGSAQGVVIPQPEPPIDNPQEVSATFSSYQCANPISQYSAVYLTSTSNTVDLADNTTSATCPAIALATSTYAAGNIGTFLKTGQITNPSWNWTLGEAIFLGTAGALTQTPPSAPYTIIQKVAWPVTSTTIEWNPTLQIIRN